MNHIFNFAQSLFHLFEDTGLIHMEQGDYECNSKAEAEMSRVGDTAAGYKQHWAFEEAS